MDVRGVAAPTGRPSGWVIALALLGVLVTGALIPVLVWSAGTLRSEDRPGAPTGESVDQPPPTGADPLSNPVCDVGEPHFRGSGPREGFLHGGGLGMPMPSGLEFGDPARMPYAFDVALLQSADAETWTGVGAVRIDDPYLTPEQASSTVTACLARADADSHLEVTETAFVQVPGVRQAHERTGLLTQEGTSREFRVLIADTGSPESLAVYVRVSDAGSPAGRAVADRETQLAAG